MDPITRAAQSFIEEARRQVERKGRRVVLVVSEPGHRGEVIKALRLWENDRDNRRPFLLCEHPYRDRESFFAATSTSVREDYQRIRSGAAEEGVELPAFGLQEGASVDALPSLDRAVVYVERAAQLLGNRLDGIMLGLLPSRIHDAASWRESVAALLAAPFSERVRLIFFDTPAGPLDALIGARARFVVDPEQVFEYIKQRATHASAGPPGPVRPALTEEQRREHEARTGQKLISEDEARALRGLVLDAGHHTSKGRFAEAEEALGKAHHICRQSGLRLEEATILVGLGGLAMTIQALDRALDCYGQAAEIGEEKGHGQLVAQAKLAMGAALVMQQKHLPAAQTYEAAAEAAQKAGLPALRLEALRMAGTCHVMRGAPHEAIAPWQRAITEGAALDVDTRRASTFGEVAEQLAVLLERGGLRQQAEHVRAMARTGRGA